MFSIVSKIIRRILQKSLMTSRKKSIAQREKKRDAENYEGKGINTLTDF